jgi:hypothetical protein
MENEQLTERFLDELEDYRSAIDEVDDGILKIANLVESGSPVSTSDLQYGIDQMGRELWAVRYQDNQS